MSKDRSGSRSRRPWCQTTYYIEATIRYLTMMDRLIRRSQSRKE